MSKLILCTMFISAFVVVSADLPVRGGLSDSKPSDETATELVTKFKSEIFSKICDNAPDKCPASEDTIIVNSYKTQTVAGTNYFISVTVGDDIYHIKISQPLSDPEKVTDVQGPKEKSDEITYF